jgi:hypothetical protein
MSKTLICQEKPIPTKSVTINGVLIESRISDGYVNATALCRAGGRRWNEFFRRKETRELFEKVSVEARKVASKLMEARRGRNSQTWIHPDIAIDLAQWISVDFKYAVIKLVQNELKEVLPTVTTKSPEWLKVRSDGKQVRKTLSQTAVEYKKTGVQIASMTNQIYRGTFDMDRKAVSGVLGLSEKDNLRDHLTAPSLHCISFGESVATDTLHKTKSSSDSGKRGRDASSKMRGVYEEFLNNSLLGCEVANKIKLIN